MKILHKSGNLIISFITAIHIYDMRTIFKKLACLPDISVDMVKGLAFPEFIMFVDKDHIGILKLLEILT